MSHPEYIQQLASSILTVHGSRVQHVGSTYLAELSAGRMAWAGQVETFLLLDHPTAKRCYAWKNEEEGASKTTAVLEGAAITSPRTAVQRMLAEQPQGRELGRS